jgi:methanogenic corrinoid protein MtbC1
MNRQREVIEALEAAGLRPKVKVLVGGAPVTPAWVAEIHADGYGADAIGAVAEARRLVGAYRGGRIYAAENRSAGRPHD